LSDQSHNRWINPFRNDQTSLANQRIAVEYCDKTAAWVALNTVEGRRVRGAKFSSSQVHPRTPTTRTSTAAQTRGRRGETTFNIQQQHRHQSARIAGHKQTRRTKSNNNDDDDNNNNDNDNDNESDQATTTNEQTSALYFRTG